MDLDSRIRGQSQVIGVVLIVGIVVVLAGIAGVYIIDLFDGDVEEAPQANFEVEQYGDGTQQAWLYHSGGDVIKDTEAITVTVNGTDVPSNNGVSFEDADGKIDAQTSLYFAKDVPSGDLDASKDADFHGANVEALDPGTTIRIVWNPEEASNSAILFEYDVEPRS
jgi:flagellin-like protein